MTAHNDCDPWHGLGEQAELRAERWLQRSIDFCRTVLDYSGEAVTQITRSQLLQMQGERQEAISALSVGLTILDDLADPLR